jgi:hypothetical protein
VRLPGQVVESAESARNYVHASADALRSPVPDPTDLTLPKALRVAPACEVNLSGGVRKKMGH